MQRRKEYLSDLCLEEGKYILEGDFENPVHNGFVIQREFQSPIPIEVSMGKKKLKNKWLQLLNIIMLIMVL